MNTNQRFSGPEMEFMRACLAKLLEASETIPRPPPDLDWEKLIILLEKHRLAAIFYTLGQKNSDIYPESIRSRLKQSRYGLLLYGDQCRLQVRDVLRAITEAGLWVIVMKGWALIPTLYADDHAQRFCEDMDILVAPEYTDGVELVLRKLGYTHINEVTPDYARRYNNGRDYLLADGNPQAFRKFSIGLHWGLTQYPYYDKNSINISAIFSRALPLKVAGVDTLQMCVEDQIVYTCAHLSLHHRNMEILLNYFEIAAIIHSNKSTLNWGRIIIRAREWGYLVQLQNVLQRVKDIWPQIIPADAFRMVMGEKPSWKERLTDSMVENTKGNPIRSGLFEVLAIPGFTNKISALAHQLFPDRDYMQVRYGIGAEKSLLPFYLRRMTDAFPRIFHKNPDDASS